MNIFKLLVVFFLCYLPSVVQGQSMVDSLIQRLPQTKGDTARVRLYKAIVEQLGDQPKQAIHYANEGMKLVKKMGWSKGVAVFNGILGRLYTDQGNYARAKTLIQVELSIHQQNKDSFNLASAYNAMGTNYLRQGQYSQSLDVYLQALRVSEQAKLTVLTPIILQNISILYSDQNNFSKALAYNRRALQQHQENSDSLGIASSYASMANQYQLRNETSKALHYYQKALFLYQKLDAKLKLAEAYQNQALLIKSLHQRLQVQLQAQAIWDQSFPAHQLSITNLGNIGWSFLDSSKQKASAKRFALQKATQYLQRAFALADSVQDAGNQHFLLGLKAELEAAKGNHVAAYRALYQYHEQHDSIYSQESKNKLAEAESNYFLEKKNAEIAIQRLTISNQRKVQWAFALGSLLLLLIAFLFYRLSQIRRKSNQQLQQLNQSLDQANRQKAQLLAVLSHDLRHPLSNLISLLHLQKNAPDLLTPEMASQNQDRITNNTEVLLENLENMLLWSKEQMNQAAVELQPVKVETLFQRLEHTFSMHDQIEWKFACPEDFQLHTDPNYLWIILQNLSSNASKALKNQNGACIQWKAWSEGVQKFLSIEDNGPGFPITLLEGFNGLQHETLLSGFGLQVVQDFAQKLGINLHFKNLPTGGAKVVLKMGV